jgi:hypothetical protein
MPRVRTAAPALRSTTFRFSITTTSSRTRRGAKTRYDQWLSTQVPALLATPGFAPGGTDVLFVVADQQADVVVNSAPIPLVIVSPLAKQVRTNAQYNHHSLLATIEDGLGVPRLGSAQGAAPISDVWK